MKKPNYKEYSYCIVIVTFNRINLLKECLEHALNQTVAPEKIVVVNNCSTDGTLEYLNTHYSNNSLFEIFHSKENNGGSWGFSKGMQIAMEHTTAEWFLMIDDDAILDYSCMEEMSPLNVSENVKAIACSVIENGKINTFHRRNINDKIDESMYKSDSFTCELASFCGLMVHRSLVQEIGYPLAEYFIWFDDSEYSMRFKGKTSIVVQTNAKLIHKVKNVNSNKTSQISWKEYYDVRNQIDMYRRHGYFLKLVRKTMTSIFKALFTKNSEKRKMYLIALYDGYRGNLGKNEVYSPK